MAKFAPNYMSVYDGYTLAGLALSAATFANGAAEDVAIGTLSGMAAEGSTLSVEAGTGFVKLSGNDLVVGPTSSSAGDLNVTIRETNPNGEGGFHDTDFVITVT